MKKVEIKLKRSAIAPLLDFIKPLADDLKAGKGSDPQLPEDFDADLRTAWNEGLVESLGRDTDTLMGLFNSRFFEEGAIEIDARNAESVLRASAAIRLRLRTCFLRKFSDEELESGRLDHARMTRDEQRGYGCFLFLATIQEVVVEHLDSIEGRDS